MNKLSSTFALLAFCAAPLSATALAESAVQWIAVDEIKAEITSLDLEKSSFSVKLEGREVSLTYDERTQFMLDGEKSSAERVLAVGRTVSVSHAEGKASKVSARSASH